MSGALGAPIVSEFYYQKPRQMMEDRRWCARVFLHAYAVGFPDVSGESPRVGASSARCGLVEEERMDTEQEWHCCVCPLTPELRAALQDMTPKDEEARVLMDTIGETGLLDVKHEAVHVMGTEGRKGEIDDKYFPWSSEVNPIEVGDLGKARDWYGQPVSKGRGKGYGKPHREESLRRPRMKPRRNMHGGRGRGQSPSPRPRVPMRKRKRSCGRSPGPGPARGRRCRSRSASGNNVDEDGAYLHRVLGLVV